MNDGDVFVLAKSDGRRAKKMAVRLRKLGRLLRKLRALQHSGPSRDQLPTRIGAAKTEAGRAFGFVMLPDRDQAVTRQSFRFRVDKDMQLRQIEAAFRSMKSELGIRPIDRQLEHRVEPHILIAFLAYSLMVTLKHRLQAHAPGLRREPYWRNWPPFRCWRCGCQPPAAARW